MTLAQHLRQANGARMEIVNVMISKIEGGIEQMFLNYNIALKKSGFDVIAVVDKKCALKKNIRTKIVEINFQKYNPLLILKLYFKLKKFAPDVIVVHSKKAIPMFKVLSKMLKSKLVGVAHNPKIKRLEMCDGIFSVTQNQLDKMHEAGLETKSMFVVPNMIEMPNKEPVYQPYRKPVIIGTMGRFEPIKGFCDLLDALSLLKKKGVPFRAIIGGKNNAAYDAEEKRIFQKVKDLKLEDDVTFCGWVSDKAAFFKNIDVFVLPSLEESFGVVLLEAALFKKPIVCSDADGPKEVWANTDAALVFERGNVKMLAGKLEEMIKKPAFAQETAQKAYTLVKNKYSINAAAKILAEALESVAEEK